MHNRVLILGLGQYPQGSGVSAALFCARRGGDVVVADKKTAVELTATVRLLRRFNNVRLRLGGKSVSLRGVTMIVRNPGVRQNHPLLQEARRRQIPIESDVTLFLKRCPAPVVGITGTRGKSTTTALTAAMLRASGFTTHMGGNITVSPLTFLAKVKKNHRVVLELSSWLVESMEEQHLSPAVGLITNVLPDHLNAYPSMSAYARAKEGLFQHQDAAMIGVFRRDQPVTRAMGRRTPGERWWWSMTPFAEEQGGFARGDALVIRRAGKERIVARRADLRLAGAHNWANAVAAATAASAAGATAHGVRKALRDFDGLPGRQELIRTAHGVRYINDTTATTPDGLLAGLAAFGTKKKNIVLIAGGSDKELSFASIRAPIRRHVRGLVLLPGSGTDRLVNMLKNVPVPTVRAQDMQSAVEAAAAVARSGDVVLLSPACASFGLFKNEFDRGDQFRTAVKKI